jgi:hypothetical protein
MLNRGWDPAKRERPKLFAISLCPIVDTPKDLLTLTSSNVLIFPTKATPATYNQSTHYLSNRHCTYLTAAHQSVKRSVVRNLSVVSQDSVISLFLEQTNWYALTHEFALAKILGLSASKRIVGVSNQNLDAAPEIRLVQPIIIP